MRTSPAALTVLLVLACSASAQDGVWFANYDPGLAASAVTKYAFDGTVLFDVTLPGAPRVCYTAAVDYAQNVWITDLNGMIHRIDSGGTLQTSWSAGTTPQGVSIDAQDNVVVVSRGGRTVTKYSPGGTAIATATTPRACLSCVVDPQGNVWVPDFDLGGTAATFELYRYTTNLTNLTTFSYTPVSSGRWGMSGIAADPGGDVYVANQDRSSVMRINGSSGAVTWETTLPHGYGRGVAVDAFGYVWCAGHAGRHVYKLRATDGAILASMARQSNWPFCGVLIDAQGDVWSLGNSRPPSINDCIGKWHRGDGTSLFTSNQRQGSTVAVGDSSGFHSAVFLNGSKDLDGDGFSNLAEARAGSNYMDIFTTPLKPTPIVTGPFQSGSTMYVTLRHKASAGMSYALAFSLGTAPGIPIPGVGTIPLNADALFFLSLLAGPPIFNNMQGVLDADGDALANVQLPAGVPPGITAYCAFITYSTGVNVISNPKPVTTS